jgi:serine/threonine protein phosphatase PrpC
MRFDSRVFQLPKDPQAPADCQDACNVDASRGVAAVADGVSSSLFAGPWASILTAAVVADPPDAADRQAFFGWLTERRTAWSRQIDASNLAWFQKVKLKQGAFSTLLWIRLAAAGPQYRIRAAAVGDCCLFHVRGGGLLRSFPLLKSDELNDSPQALGSVDLNQDQYLRIATFDDTCTPGDLLVLCSDAMAGWILREYESGRCPAWDRYWTTTQEAWRAEIIGRRTAQEIRYDDTTLVLLRVGDDQPVPPISAEVVEPVEPPQEPPPGGSTESEVRRWAESIASASEDLAEQVSDEMMKGMRKLKDSLVQKYREKFLPKDPKRRPPA